VRKLSFFYKLLFSFIAIGIIPLLLVGLIAYGLLTNTIMDTVSRQAYNSVVKISENIDILTSEYGEIIVSLLSEDERLREALAGKITEDYPVIRQKIAVLAGKRNTALYILNPKGTVVFATHPLPRFYDPVLYRNQGLFQQADALKNGYIIYPHHYVNSIGDNVVYSIARTIRDERDRPIGYIIVEIFKSHIEDIANNINANLNLDLLVVDSNFFTVANLRSPKLDGKTFHFSQNRKLTAMGTGFFLARVAGKQSLIAFHTSKYTRFVTIGILPVKVLLESSNFIRFITLLACLLSSVVCLILAVLISRNISRPIYDLVESMKQVESGNLHARVNFQRRDELGLLGRSFNAMVGRIQDLVDNVVAKQRQLRNSEIKALQAQINPHFLYNTLDSIKWLAKLNHVPQISVIATQLGKLLRSSINDADLTTVEESIVTIQSYLAIQKIRYRDKFATVVEIEPNILHCRIPKLILQPIVENAIVHGFEGKKSQGCLSIRGWSEQSDLIFEVADNGVGMKPEWVAAINAGQNIQSASADAHSIGIQNVNRRIQLYYGPEYRLTVQSLLDRGTKVTLRMPIQPETEISKQFAPEDAK
jgi:two-component system sensor histidine kinase YesM